MSRAFVKETDGESGDEPLPPDSPHPLYVTPDGLAELRSRHDALAAEVAGRSPPAEPAAAQHFQRQRRELRLLERKLARAVEIDPAQHPADAVAFGHWVTAEDDDGHDSLYRIVGEDQADPAHGWISWLSPLAQALRGASAGDRVVWRRPAGDLALTVLAIGTEAPLAERPRRG